MTETATGVQRTTQRKIAELSEKCGYAVLLLYIALVPFGRFLVSVNNALILIAAALALGAFLFRTSSKRVHVYQLSIVSALLIILVWSIIVATSAPNPVSDIIRSKVFALRLLVVGAFVLLVNSYERVSGVLVLITLLVAAIGILSVLHLAVGLPFGKPIGQVRSFGPISLGISRTLGVEMGYGSYGTLANIGLAFAMIASWRPSILPAFAPSRVRFGGKLCLTAIVIGVIIAQSRSTYLSVTTSVITLAGFVTVLYGSRRVRLVALFSGCLTALVGTVFVGPELYQGVITANKASVTNRARQYIGSIQAILQSPITGCGWNCVYALTDRDVAVHNAWLVTGLTAGIPGLLLWTVPFMTYLVAGVRGMTTERPPVSLLAIALVVGTVGVVLELLLYPGISDTVAVFLGTGVSVLGLFRGPKFEFRF